MTLADRFRAHVLAANSVTLAMEDWCREHGIGALPLHSAVHIRADEAELPRGLGLGREAGEEVCFRQITLMAGDVRLLDADNWFLPGRLPAEAVRLLRETDTPFGAALRGGRQTRRSAEVLLPEGATGQGHPAPGVALLTLRGVVSLDGRPVSFVEERFRPEALGAQAATD
ncbi:hypothetical protein [Palleronia caenipelagi]|uniref:Chorismate lyase n=1 Tax=Palleronia caenipelagi TaxID=2489174 RepID=A0A547QAT1_9RHOB|nr:hypothetical protein [Palleronia caenipelagi]TRD23489.1 hypothetical protein FEV53_00285 [Palleronia caenipelagi]